MFSISNLFDSDGNMYVFLPGTGCIGQARTYDQTYDLIPPSNVTSGNVTDLKCNCGSALIIKSSLREILGILLF